MSASESRSAVVLELAEEFLERYRRGERPSLKEYIDRHPDLAAEIKEVFPAMAMMENVALADESLAGGATPTAAPPAPEALQQLGDFRILREVGRGGMGIVYEAEQVSLGRHVALKVLPRKVLLDAQQKRRFEREAKAAARLHHTNIVPIFGVGEQDGLPYYVMQFIQGLGLDQVLDELRHLQGGGTPSASALGEPRVTRKDVTAVDVARSLLTGAFSDGERGASAPCSPQQGADAPRSPESDTGKLSDSFTISSSLHLPRADGAGGSGKSKKTNYWQSVAQLGVQVAGALEYAHKQGIQHRDIKPSNLLLDTRGAVWVTDFGLARADNEDHLTITGDIVGTLRYMPPEAFEGRTDARSDLYSLGLTLYELLAFQPAFQEKERHRLIKQVTTAEPARLDKLQRAIPRDLATIVHKAIDRDPARRYQNAGGLADDLQRFLDDEPIRARRVSAFERGWRWCRHHPAEASLAATLTLILLAVTLASLVAASRFDGLARQQAAAAESERQARRAAVEAQEHEAALRKQAEEAKTQAETNLQEAKSQKQQAEANFAKARKAVDDYFTTVSESQLLQVPGMQPLRRDLLQSALAFYQDFLKEHGDDPAIRAELAAAYRRVGKIRSELGEGAAAREAYRQAGELYEALTKAAPESVEWRHGLARCYYALGRTDDAIALWEKLVQPGQPQFQKELADAYNHRGVGHSHAARLGEALQAYQQSLALREMLVRLNPDDPAARRDLGGTLNNIGVLLSKKGRREDALVMYRRAAEQAEAAFAQAPQVIVNGRGVALFHGNIAAIERQLKHAKEALAAYQRVVEVWRKLARDNPAVPSLHSALFGAYRNLARYQRQLKQAEQADRTMRLAREMIERLPSDGPDALFNLACVRSDCATFLGLGKEKATAEEQAEQKQEADAAMEALRQAVAAGFRNATRLRTASELNGLRGREDFKVLEADLAARVAAASPDKLTASQKALAVRQKMAQADPKNKRLQADLAASQHAIALIQLDLGKPDEARKHLDQAVALREALVKDDPKNARYQTDLTASRFALGDCYWQSGRLAEGAKEWQRNLDALEAAERAGAGGSVPSGQLYVMRRTVAQQYARAGLWPEAAAQYGRLIQLDEASAFDHYCAACLARRAGDAAACRRAAEAMVKRFGELQDYYTLGFLAWAGGLADGAGTDPSAAIKWARKMTDDDPPNNPWECHILGLAHYRAGQFAEAAAQASKSNTINAAWASRILNWPVLAMAHHRLGNAAQAQQWLEKSTAEWRRLSPLPLSPGGLMVLPSRPAHWQQNWHDWPTFEILLHEATVLIAGAPPVEDAFGHAHRGLLHSRLGESGKAEAELQAAVKLAPREPALWLAHGRWLAELKRGGEAEADFAKAVAINPEDAQVWKERGQLRFELGQTDKATADFRKAVELLGDKAEPTGPAVSEADKLFARLADDASVARLTAAVEQNPEDMSKRWQRGEWYARHARWKEAAGDFTIALERNPPEDTYLWVHAAPALAAAGDREVYGRLCRAMVERFGESQDLPTNERTAKLCLLLPEASKDTELAYRLADRAVTLGKDHKWAHYFVFCKGLADYRRGDFRAAVAVLDPLAPRIASTPQLIASRHLLLAMALHRQGEAKAARGHLALGAKLLHQHVPEPGRFPTFVSKDPSYDHDWLIAWLLHREARTLMEGEKAEPKK